MCVRVAQDIHSFFISLPCQGEWKMNTHVYTHPTHSCDCVRLVKGSLSNFVIVKSRS